MGILTTSLLVLFAVVGLTYADQLKLCVTSQEEMTKCGTFTDIGCVLAEDGIDCVEKIKNNEADITTLDGGDIYLAGKCHDMRPIMAEGTNEMSGYYAVAVAKRSSEVTINTLKGTKSCHTGVNKTSGWFVPMSILFKDKSNQLKQASDFFEQSCVPGAQRGSNLCKLCYPNCERNSNNLYYGYNGAATCLQETDADVAFVKHLTFLKNANAADFELLCKDGSTSSIEDYLNCHLARVPAHAVMAKVGTTPEEIDQISAKLLETPPEILFSNGYGKNNIFSSSTLLLTKTYDSYDKYLGSDYIKALPERVC